MSPDYPNSGNFYTMNGESGRYEPSAPPAGTLLSTVPVMNRAERRRQERMAGAFKKHGKRR